MLTVKDAMLLVVDFQGKLARIVQESEAVIAAAGKLIRGARLFELPIVHTEQNPDGLGGTVGEIADLLEGEALAKLAFSCWQEPRIRQAVEQTARRQVLLCGIEAHVCVFQTGADLLEAGFEVHVVADAVSSRTERNRRIALDRLAAAGAQITSVETALFELMHVARGERFKRLLAIVK